MDLNKNKTAIYKYCSLTITKMISFFYNFIWLKIFRLFNRKSLQNLSHYNHKILSTESSITLKDFYTKQVKDVMLPRADIIAVKHDVDINELANVIVQTHHSRILVYRDNLDNIIGFVHIKDIFKLLACNNKKYDINNLIREYIVSTHLVYLNELLAEMQLKHIYIAVVVDEYGGIDGIITVGDILKTILGRVNDEFTPNDMECQILRKGIAIVSGRAQIKDLEKSLGITLDKKTGVDTIGGLIISHAGIVPTNRSIIKLTPNINVEILESNPRSLKKLKIMYK
ncbi:CBS domain-containing protein [Rickettsia endosymbiont of Cardiosporidium cionae]|uniref:CBS domain-containing protein n=1 Tax=Rickettsia endosymbiont of Cardiosporidium cionae TaxID=2777155 RepID=UPI0018956F1B|nr:CBS domain-containing protein [Rickettsia endosymbiont of Cardiosporidium cionae]KAF8818883.1 HlyC/CorC family transporter [Rickettsia endosymbiont of Cardiosporidium cionae]